MDGWVRCGTRESSVIERNDLFILFTDKENINIFFCKQSYLHEQHTYIFRKYISPLSLEHHHSFAWYTPNSHALAILFWISITWNWNFPQYIYTSNDVRILTARRAELLLRAGFQFKCNTQKNRNIIWNKMKSTKTGEGEFYQNYFKNWISIIDKYIATLVVVVS